MKVCTEEIHCLGFKICLFIVPVQKGETTYILAESESLENNALKV